MISTANILINARTAFGPSERMADPQSQLIQSLIDASNTLVVILDEKQTIVFANRTWRQFAAEIGSSNLDFGIGRVYSELFGGIAAAATSDATNINAGLKSIVAGDEIEFEYTYQCSRVGTPHWFQLNARSFSLGGIASRRLVFVSHADVSASRSLLKELSKDEMRLRRLLKTSNIIPWEGNVGNMRFTYVGEEAIDVLGFTPREMLEESFWMEHVHPADQARVVAEYSTHSKTVDHFRSNYRMHAKDGRIVWVEDFVDIVQRWPKEPLMQGFLRDITERKEIEIALADLGGRLIGAQENERKRIARELHDDLNQRIALISIELEQVAQGSPMAPVALSERLRAIQQKVGEVSTDIHRMSYELHPSKLDHLGLVPALNSFCSDASRSRGMKVHFISDCVPASLNRDITLCVFRVAQEAVQNAAKHSGCSKVVVSVTGADDRLDLKVSDEGRGFLVKTRRLAAGLGLTSMKERVRQVGGDLKITSEPGRGTVVEVSLPI